MESEITLNNGAVVPAVMYYLICDVLNGLRQTEPVAFIELVRACYDVNYAIGFSSAQQTLLDLQIVSSFNDDDHPLIPAITRQIVVACTEPEGMFYRLVPGV